MASLIYSAITSLDGYIEDAGGRFDWAAPDDEVHAFVNDQERPIGTYLYGRRMYQTMRFWATALDEPDLPEVGRDYATVWQAAEKIVYSATLDAAPTARTRIERTFDPAAVGSLKDAATSDLSIGGPALAAMALLAGLVDEIRLLVVPVAVGGGKGALPHDIRLDLELLAERRFRSGTVHLGYRVRH